MPSPLLLLLSVLSGQTEDVDLGTSLRKGLFHRRPSCSCCIITAHLMSVRALKH